METAPYLPLYHATSKGIVLSPIHESRLHRKIGTAFVFLPLVLFAALICVAASTVRGRVGVQDGRTGHHNMIGMA
jgi:hypothetical protein